VSIIKNKMKILTLNKNNSGFNLVELMVSIAIMSVLMVMAFPSFSAWMANSRVRNVSEAVNYGLLQARSEAVRRNELVTFTLNTDSSFTVKSAAGTVLNQKAASESSMKTNITLNPNTATTVTFNGVGGVSPNFDSTDTLTDLAVDSLESGDGIRSSTIRVGEGGSITMCSYYKSTTPTC
jgi:prepilin-type N-terminal cleavage/methylation domain-containing protein